MARINPNMLIDGGGDSFNTAPGSTKTPLQQLQESVAESKKQANKKNIEIPTIALEQAINSGNLDAIQTAATSLGKAQGLTGSELRTFAYNTTQSAAKGEKPADPPSDSHFVYRYVWRQDVGGPGGKWVLTKTPVLSSGNKPVGNVGNVGDNSGNANTGTYTASDGTVFTDQNAYVAYQNNLRNTNLANQTVTAQATAERKSAYDLLYKQFAQYGLQSLVAPLESLIKEGIPASEFAIRLRDTDAYKKRFAANAQRINKGLKALSEAEYLGLEDAYQGIMRQYGLPESYYTRGDMGIQQGFEKFIAGDVSPAELETRISTAYNRVINANPEVVQALKQFYPNITNGDILSYALDPQRALSDINKKVTAAEIGGAAIGAGLAVDTARAEQLGAFGVTKAQAEQGYQTIADILPSATKLSDIYGKQGLGPYTQQTAEQEVFGISGAADAATKRRKLAQLETAQFSGQTGVGALSRERAGQF